MFSDFGRCGSIDDVGFGMRWETGMLAHEAARRAAILAQRRIGPGSVVAISHSGSAHFFADLFAVWTVGAAAACLDSTLTDLELQTVIGFVKPAALLVNQTKISNTPAVPVLELASNRPTEPWAGSQRVTDLDPDRPALILFTSGTTGSPKGVVLTYRALQARIKLNIAAIGATALKRTLVTLPTHFGHGLIGNALTALLSGGDIILYPPGALVGDQLGRIIDKHSVSFLSSVPAFWNLVRGSSDPPAGDSLVRVHVGSAPLSAKLWSQIVAWSRADVVNCYGMTETANWIAGASSRHDGIADGLVGKTWGGMAAVIDDRGAFQRTGEGEIIVQSPCLTSGYFNRPDLTANVMTNGWFRTGDRGIIDELGRIRLTGRIKDEINRAGFKVQPAEIDMLIETHPEVAEACVFGIPDSISGEAIGAAVRLVQHSAADARSLQAWCRERLRRGAVPEHWFIVDSIPRNVRGKVNRDAVRQKLVATIDTPKSNIDTRRTRTTPSLTERTWNNAGPVKNASQATAADRVGVAVERAWTSVLDRRSFRANTQWDLAGGDSIGAMRLWLQIEQQLAVPLPLDHLEFNATPKKLICTIEKLLESPDRQSVVVPLRQQRPLIFLLPPAHGDTPSLAQFRAAFEGRVRFEVIRYPKLNEFIDSGAEFNVMVDAAVAQILAKGPHEPYYLAGYSFGGFVAWETARRMLESGHEIGFLGLIDTRLIAPRQERRSIFTKARDYVRRTWLRLKSKGSKVSRPAIHTTILRFGVSFWDACAAAYQDILWWLFEALARNCPWSLLRKIDCLAKSLPGSAAITFQLELIVRLRSHALQRQTIEPLDVSTTLFRSDERCGDAPDYGWGKLCTQLVVLPIRGGHLSLFEAEYRKSLCTRFLQSVEAARASRRTNMIKTGS
jgi:oxalate---CoA ligase